jgi:hypothetical protein
MLQDVIHDGTGKRVRSERHGRFIHQMGFKPIPSAVCDQKGIHIYSYSVWPVSQEIPNTAPDIQNTS